MMPRIVYRNIVDGLDFYSQQRQYRYIEVPWIVSHGAINATLPPSARAFETEGGGLVGSGEQGFVELMLRGELPAGRYVCATPCFRDDAVDALHQKTFFKVELIETFPNNFPDSRDRMIEDALKGFRYLGIHNPRVEQTSDGFDIVDGRFGIELGSYGIRFVGELCWTYGTGVAEPRCSTVLCRQTCEP